MKYETNEQLRMLIARAYAQQQQQEQIQRAVNAGDQELAHFYSQKPEVQQTMLARQDIEDAAAAAAAGDERGMRQGITSAMSRAIYGGAQLGPRQQRQHPRRRNHR